MYKIWLSNAQCHLFTFVFPCNSIGHKICLDFNNFSFQNVESLTMNTDLTIIGHEAIDIVGINQGTQDKLRKLKVMVMNLY